MKFLAQFDMGTIKNHRLNLNHEDKDGGLLLEEEKPQLKRPSMYKVVMLNDDYTPMEFVVHVLEAFFAMDREAATRIMLQVHSQGKAICGVYTRDIAETKAMQVIEYAQQNEHPLICEIEVVDEEQ